MRPARPDWQKIRYAVSLDFCNSCSKDGTFSEQYKKEKKVRIYKSILDPYKNIIDENYIKQLTGYKKYIENKTKRHVNTYLYSILSEEIKVIEWMKIMKI